MIRHTANIAGRSFKTYLVAGLLFTGGSIIATSALAVPGSEAGCPNVNPGLTITVGANESQFLKEEAKVILRGDVTIDQGVLHLAADEVTIEYLQGDTRDKGTQGKVNSLLARGTVKIVCENDRAHGGEAYYNVSGQTIRLTHNVLLVRENNILKGETLFIDLGTGHMTIEGGGTPVTEGEETARDTRIKAVFTPATSDPAAGEKVQGDQADTMENEAEAPDEPDSQSDAPANDQPDAGTGPEDPPVAPEG